MGRRTEVSAFSLSRWKACPPPLITPWYLIGSDSISRSSHGDKDRKSSRGSAPLISESSLSARRDDPPSSRRGSRPTSIPTVMEEEARAASGHTSPSRAADDTLSKRSSSRQSRKSSRVPQESLDRSLLMEREPMLPEHTFTDHGYFSTDSVEEDDMGRLLRKSIPSPTAGATSPLRGNRSRNHAAANLYKSTGASRADIPSLLMGDPLPVNLREELVRQAIKGKRRSCRSFVL